MSSADEQFRIRLAPTDRLLAALVQAQRAPVLGRLLRQLLKWRGTDVPAQTLAPGRGLVLQHGGHVVVHYSTRLGAGVTLMHNSTIGRANLWEPERPDFVGVVVEDDVIIGTGAAVLSTGRPITLGRGSIIGANAVLTRSTGPGEIWAGNPARLVRHRDAKAA